MSDNLDASPVHPVVRTPDAGETPEGDSIYITQYALWNPSTGKKDELLYLCEKHRDLFAHFEPEEVPRALPDQECELCEFANR